MDIMGFDFGTTNSLISYVEGARCVVAYGERDMPHPSVVCYEGDNVIVGHEAKKRVSGSGTGVVGNVVRSPKTLLGEHSVHVEGIARNPRDIVADIVRFVVSEAKSRLKHNEHSKEDDFSRAVVTIPVDMNGDRRRILREAFRQSGVVIEQFVHEPLAALYCYLRDLPDFETQIKRLNRQYVLVFDWGGGTLDLTLCQISNGVLVQVQNDGCSNIGGDVIDDHIKNEVVRRSLVNRGISDTVEASVDAEQRLMARAELAKIKLSDADEAIIYLPNYFMTETIDPDLEYQITRDELEELVNPIIKTGIERIHRLLSNAGLVPADIALCLATGGMVNMPMIKSRLHEVFGPQRVRVSERGNSIISEGAAWIAHDKMELKLAKNIEIAVSRNTFFPVIKAGATLPREGMINETEHLTLYCTDPRDGVAKIQLLAPIRHGRQVQLSDQRKSLACLTVKVDPKSQKLFERIDVAMHVDENLILSIDASSTVAGDTDSVEVHDLEFGLGIGFIELGNEPETEDQPVKKF